MAIYKKRIKRANVMQSSADRRKNRQLNVLRGLVQQMARAIETIAESKNQPDGPLDFFDEVERFEIELIQGALRQTGNSQIRAAKLLGMRNTTLNSKIKKYGIPLSTPEEALVERVAEQPAAVQWNN
jgi:transcriptional regulator with GAF, ATPase, and Fis domain